MLPHSSFSSMNITVVKRIEYSLINTSSYKNDDGKDKVVPFQFDIRIT